MKWIGQNIYDQVSKFRNTVDFSEDVTFYQPVNNADPQISIGSSDAERLQIFASYSGTGSQTMQQAMFVTHTESSTANDGMFTFSVDGATILDFKDAGINLRAGMGIAINGADILTDSSGTATLSNIDALDATTIATFNAALTAGDITGVTAGTGMTGGGTSGAITLNVIGGTGITANANDIALTTGLIGDGSNIISLGTIEEGTWQGTTIKTAYIGDDQVTEDKLADTLLAEIDANTAKVTNVATNLTATTHASQITINSSDGTNVIVAEASGSIAGVMSVTHHDKLDAIEASATADQSKSDIDGLAITTVGTLDTGNATAIVSAASTTVAGKVELATTAEATTGTDTARAVTPAGLKAYADRPAKQIVLKNFNFVADSGTTETFFPFAGTAEKTSDTDAAIVMIAPTAGKLLKLYMRASRDHSGQTTTITLYNWDSDEVFSSGNKSSLGVQSATGPNTNEVVTFDFTSSLDSGTNAFTALETLAISYDNASAIGGGNTKYFFTAVFEYDFSGY